MVADSEDVSDAFAALGDETRVNILAALVEARRENPREPGVAFSDLRERVGVEDSGRFNYHLGKLRGRFVESDDGVYELTAAGNDVVGAILAGRYDEDVAMEPRSLDASCPLCDAAVTARYEDDRLRVECDETHSLLVTPVPPAAAANRTVEALLSFATRTTYAWLDLVTDGICSECYGEVTGEIREIEDGDDALPTYGYHTECERCGFVTGSTVSVAVLRHPAFVAFCHDHGVELTGRLPWTLHGVVDDDTERVDDEAEAVDDDTERYETTFRLDDEVFVATLTASGDVVETGRRPA